MTDNEIIKALECCISAENCCECVYTKMCDGTTIHQFALDLINRQKAEIEELKKENDELKNGFFQEHYKENECQELLSVKEAWRKESLHNIDLEAKIERLQNDYLSMQSTLAKMSMGVEQAKVEAIQDYIGKVKYELYMTNGWDKNKIIFDILDSIYNKMVEANK